MNKFFLLISYWRTHYYNLWWPFPKRLFSEELVHLKIKMCVRVCEREKVTLSACALRRSPVYFAFKSSNASFTAFFIRFRSSSVFRFAGGIMILATSQGLDT